MTLDRVFQRDKSKIQRMTAKVKRKADYFWYIPADINREKDAYHIILEEMWSYRKKKEFVKDMKNAKIFSLE